VAGWSGNGRAEPPGLAWPGLSGCGWLEERTYEDERRREKREREIEASGLRLCVRALYVCVCVCIYICAVRCGVV